MVLRRLFLLPLRPSPTAPRLPKGQRVYAIGDVHGRLDLLEKLVALIEADHHARGPADKTMIFLGDLIDRGPDSRGVIAFARRRAAECRCKFLMGNHEEMLLRIWDGNADKAAIFLLHGGDALLRSYGADPLNLSPSETVYAVQSAVPDADIDFLRGFDPMYRAGDYVFVHAGVRPRIPLSAQDPIDLRWIRTEFTQSDADFGAVIVHGHSVSDVPEFRPNRIGIDTGAYRSGKLTALGLEGPARWILST